jgi:hypothetical protein
MCSPSYAPVCVWRLPHNPPQEFFRYTYLWTTDVNAMFAQFLEQAVSSYDDDDAEGTYFTTPSPPAHTHTYVHTHAHTARATLGVHTRSGSGRLLHARVLSWFYLYYDHTNTLIHALIGRIRDANIQTHTLTLYHLASQGRPEPAVREAAVRGPGHVRRADQGAPLCIDACLRLPTITPRITSQAARPREGPPRHIHVMLDAASPKASPPTDTHKPSKQQTNRPTNQHTTHRPTHTQTHQPTHRPTWSCSRTWRA